jgi:aryl-alcohol dehydrogenase-like predicted oxidoreductase
MRKRTLGNTGLSVSELGLGTWGISGDAYGEVSDAEADRVIDRAVQIGITLFDTADVYGSSTSQVGAMERKLGRRLPLASTHVVTKIGTNVEGYPQKQFDAMFLFNQFERSEERLRRCPVDVVLLHNPSAATLRKDEATGKMAEIVDQGRALAWGVSAGTLEVARLAIEKGAQVIELAFNAFHAKDARALASTLEERGVGLLARSVLSHGLLAGQWSPEREFWPGDHRAERWNPPEMARRIAQLAALRTAFSGPVQTVRAVALRFVLEHDRVSSAILGPRSVGQLDQLVREAGRQPPYLQRGLMQALETKLLAHGIELDETETEP